MENNHGKLVRNNIPEIIEADGKTPITRVLNKGQFLLALIDKLREETDEFAVDLSIEELADIVEVTEAIRQARGFTREDLENARQAKAASNGDFSDRIYLEGVE